MPNSAGVSDSEFEQKLRALGQAMTAADSGAILRMPCPFCGTRLAVFYLSGDKTGHHLALVHCPQRCFDAPSGDTGPRWRKFRWSTQ